MNVYRFKASTDERWRSIYAVDQEFEAWDRFGAVRLAPTWTPLTVEVVDSDQDPEANGGAPRDYGDLPIPDFPCNFGCHNVVSRRAADVLADFLIGPYEVLPVKCDFGDYCAINVLKVIDAADTDRSVVRRFKHPPFRVWEINRYAWRVELLRDAAIFRLPFSQFKTYCTEPVVQRIRDAGLTGFSDEISPSVD